MFCRVPVASTATAATSSYAQATDATRAGQTKLRFYLAGKLVPSTFTIFQVSPCSFIHLPSFQSLWVVCSALDACLTSVKLHLCRLPAIMPCWDHCFSTLMCCRCSLGLAKPAAVSRAFVAACFQGCLIQLTDIPIPILLLALLSAG